MKKMFLKGGFVFLLVLTGVRIHAQDETAALVTVLKTELAKGDVQVESKNTSLEKLQHNDIKRYGLAGKPSDAFYIKATTTLIDIKSESVYGLRNGIYWYLNYLGFRYYFPGKTWQFVPKLQSAFKPVEKTVSPSFTYRRIWYAYGTGSKQADAERRKLSALDRGTFEIRKTAVFCRCGLLFARLSENLPRHSFIISFTQTASQYPF